MTVRISSSRRRGKSQSRSRNTRSLQKPNGVIGLRVKEVGGDKFAIVCVDPAKHRSEWMMADYFGNVLIEPQTLEHRSAIFKLAVEQIRTAQQQHHIQDTIVVVERTGRYYSAPKRALACQIREHMHLSMPGFAALFDRLFDHKSAMAIVRRCDSPAMVIELGRAGLTQHLRENKLRYQSRTIDKVLTWASQAAGDTIQDGPLHHAIWTDLEELYQHFQRRISALERELAGDLVQTPYVRLMAIPGINVVLAADLAGEMGPITRYANANAITGRCGLYPSRSQSDQTDNDSGPIVRQSNRRLRSVLMRIADSLAYHCSYYRGQADADEARGIDKRASHVKIAKRFSRLTLACVAGDEPLKHPCFQKPDSILEKLREFHHQHQTQLDQLLADLQAAVAQLPYNTCNHEAEIVADVLQQQTHRHRGGVAIGQLLPAVLARLESKTNKEHENRVRS